MLTRNKGLQTRGVRSDAGGQNILKKCGLFRAKLLFKVTKAVLDLSFLLFVNTGP